MAIARLSSAGTTCFSNSAHRTEGPLIIENRLTSGTRFFVETRVFHKLTVVRVEIYGEFRGQCG